MFDIFLRPKKIVLDCFCRSQQLAEMFAPRPAAMPQWMLDKPGLVEEETLEHKVMSIRNCSAINELYASSLQLVAWADYDLLVDRDRGIYKSDSTGNAESHPIEQYSGGFGGWAHVKLLQPWFFQEKTGVQWSWQDDVYHRDDPGLYRILPGVVEYKYQHSTHVNLIVPRPRQSGVNYKIGIRAGDPLVLLRPEAHGARVELRTHVCTEEELEKRFTVWRFSPWATYIRRRKIMSELEARAGQSRCPFGFGR